MSTFRIQDFNTTESLLKKLKDNKITEKKLKPVLFGATAIKALRIIRKADADTFKQVKQWHEVTYMANYAINLVINSNSFA